MAEIKKIGKFEGIYQPPIKADEVTSLIILLHGWGADAADMFGLAPILGQVKQGCAFYAPNAPYPCAASPYGREWFDIQKGENGAIMAMDDLDELLNGVFDEFSLPASQIILGGFSQGGMMTLAAGPAYQLAGLISFSGALLTEQRLAEATVSSPPILLIHGDLDDVVPATALIDAQSHLEEKGYDVEVVLEKGIGHSISETGLDSARHFIDSHLS
jgi:phospholipase/carboxylesterase